MRHRRKFIQAFIAQLLVLLIFSSNLMVFAQKPKPPQKSNKKAANPTIKLSANNLEKRAYQIWLNYYQAQQQGKQASLPIFKIPSNVEPKEAKYAQTTWEMAQFKAQRQIKREHKAASQTVESSVPNVTLPNNQALPPKQQPQSIADMTKAHIAALITNTMDTRAATNPHPAANRVEPNINMVYDGDGNRVSKTVNGVTTQYLIDSNNPTGLPQVVEELQNGEVVKQYTYGPDGLISQRQLINGEWVVSYFVKDGHNSTRLLTDANGNVTDTYDYDAFGNTINQTGNTPNNYLYAGQQYDPDLGLYYNRARYFNPSIGRFQTSDPFEGIKDDPPSLHKYLYANSDPVNRSDPSGKSAIVNTLTAVAIGLTIVSLPTLIANRVQAPTDDPVADEVGNLRITSVEQEANALNAIALSLGLAAQFAEIRSSQGIGAAGETGGAKPPFNPRGGTEKFQINCGACVGAVLRSILRRSLTTADAIESEVGAIKFGSIKNTQELLNYLTKVVEVDNARLVSKPLTLREPGSYVLVYENVPGSSVGHTVFAQVFKSGKVFIYDPQSHIQYFDNLPKVYKDFGAGKSFKLVKD